MHIPSYQIRNVLNTYRKHLCEGATEKPKAGFANAHGQNIKKAARGRRQAIIKMVDADIFDKINQFCTRLNANGKTELQVQMASEKPAELKHERKKRFAFNVIDENNEKSCHSISVEDTDFFIKSPGTGKDE
ncbi:MAG: hypothetical protein JRE58_00630 [Deltaproteobacteria bacterium]|nr:hypothetical protein [Deltaproteobacteria bacterium]MBW2591505.1 hypothetical protein [Deltaproteobacteria bacterium]